MFKKIVNGIVSQATPIYDGYYNDSQFLMSFKSKFWFDQELRGIGLVGHKPYSPEITNIDTKNMEISFKWYDSNLNHLFNYNKDLPLDWREQILSIIRDLESDGVLKINLYPHTFYIKDNKIHIMDLHACLTPDDQITEASTNGILNDNKRFVFNKEILDVDHAYRYTLKNNVGNWPGGPLSG